MSTNDTYSGGDNSTPENSENTTRSTSDMRTTRRVDYTERNAAGRHQQPSSRSQPGRRPQQYTSSGSDQVRAYGDYSRYAAARRSPKQKSPIKAIIVTAVLLLAVGIGVFAFIQTRPIDVTINGEAQQLGGKKNIETLLEEGLANPVPGNFIDVEGEVLEEGKGEALLATVNGEVTTDLTAKLSKGDDILIENGLDITEDSENTDEEVPWEFKTEGIGPLHTFSGGKNGVKTTKVGKVSGKTAVVDTDPVEDLVLAKYYPDTGEDKVIAITIDDGPWPETTEKVLDVLKKHDVKATFFVIGFRVNDMPELVKRARDEGHQIATHTWDHASGSGGGVDLGLMSEEEQKEQVEKGYDAIEQALGEAPSKVLRAPGGNFGDNVARNLSSLVDAEIGWSIDTNDWRLPGSATIADEMKSARSGDIILCHDGGGDRNQTVEALDEAIPYLKEKGFTFITVDQMLEYPAKSE